MIGCWITGCGWRRELSRLLGCWYLVLMIWPRRCSAAIPWFEGLMLVEGFILLGHGLRLSLPAFPFYWDTSACLVGGAAIVYLARYARAEQQQREESIR